MIEYKSEYEHGADVCIFAPQGELSGGFTGVGEFCCCMCANSRIKKQKQQ